MQDTFPRTISKPEEFLVKVDTAEYGLPSLLCLVSGALAIVVGAFHWYDVTQLIQQGKLSVILGICFAVFFASTLALSVIQQMQVNNLNKISADYNVWLAENYGFVSHEGFFSVEGLPKMPMEFTDMEGKTVTKTLSYGTEWKRSSPLSKDPVPYLKVALVDPEESMQEEK